MKKIKKIRELSKVEMSKTLAGQNIDLNQVAPGQNINLNQFSNNISGVVICGCCGCSYESGGSGFSIGMNVTKTPGWDCTWFSIF